MILSVINQKGGVGKTTTAVNLATGIALQGHSVLIVDLDPQGNATSGLGVEDSSSPTLYESLVASTSQKLNADFSQSPAIVDGPVPNLDVIGTSPELAGSEIDLAANEDRDDLRRVLAPLSDKYSLIIIDTPPSLSLLTVNALVAADQLIIPVQCEYYALEGLGQLLRTLELIRHRLNPGLKVLGLLRTMFDGRLGLSSQVSAELTQHFPQLLFETIIPRNVRLAEAPSHGAPVALYDPRSAGAQAYGALATEVVGRLKINNLSKDTIPNDDNAA